MKLSSYEFLHGQPLPKKFTGEGKDCSPELHWADLPHGTETLALTCHDPDAPGDEPWVHWIIYNIPAASSGLAEGVPPMASPETPSGACQGKNSGDAFGYHGPMPPRGHGVHHYHFTLFALDCSLELEAGVDRPTFLQAIRGHVLATADTVATYERKK